MGLTEAIPLIPAPPTKPTKKSKNLPKEYMFYPRGGFRWLKETIEQLSGVDFAIKDLRSTFAQMTKDRGVSIEAVSKALGHASTATTEEYYARMADRDALIEISKAWDAPIIYTPKAKNLTTP
jgi:integrase